MKYDNDVALALNLNQNYMLYVECTTAIQNAHRLADVYRKEKEKKKDIMPWLSLEVAISHLLVFAVYL